MKNMRNMKGMKGMKGFTKILLRERSHGEKFWEKGSTLHTLHILSHFAIINCTPQ